MLLGPVFDTVCGCHQEVWQAEEGTTVQRGAWCMILHLVFAVIDADTCTQSSSLQGTARCLGIKYCHQRRHIAAARTWTKTFVWVYFNSAKVKWHVKKDESDLTWYFYENGKILCVCTFSLLYICLTVFCPIYLTSHALCGLSWKKRILETQGKVLSTYTT